MMIITIIIIIIIITITIIISNNDNTNSYYYYYYYLSQLSHPLARRAIQGCIEAPFSDPPVGDGDFYG